MFCFVAATIVLISVNLLVGGLMLDSCWIMCWVFVVKNESSRLKVMEGFDEEWFGIVTFALVERKYCRIEFVVFLC